LYPIIYAHRSGSAAADEIAGLKHWLPFFQNDRIIDVCCGEGRHLHLLLRMGYDAWGFDLSRTLLRNALQHKDQQGRVVRADMRATPFAAAFDVALSLFSSFGYFLEESDNQRALQQMITLLRPGGRLVLDHMNRRYIEDTLIPASTDRMGKYTVRQQRNIAGNRVRKTIQVFDGKGRCRRFEENVRMYWPDEISAMLSKQGCRDIRIRGGFDGKPFTHGSRRMIVACRAAGGK